MYERLDIESKQTSSAGGHYDTVAEFFVQFLQMQIYKVLVFLLEN